jgi:ubiquitin C-terminal hydrolase
MSFGHYTAYVKKDDWVTYDDEKVKKCNVNGENAYLLFYKRKNDKGR